MISATRGLSASSWEGGAGAEPAVQKWASGCFRHSRPFPTTYTTSTTACWHGELHLTTTACWHGELHLTTTARRRPTAPPASPLPPLAYTVTVLDCQLRALREKHALFAHHGLFEWATSGVRLEWRTDWIDCERSLFTPCSWLRRRHVKQSWVCSAVSSVALHGLPCGQRIEYRTRNSEAGCSIPSLASDCGQQSTVFSRHFTEDCLKYGKFWVIDKFSYKLLINTALCVKRYVHIFDIV